MDQQIVYRLYPILDNPRFEGFATKEGSFPETFPRGIKSRDWQALRLAPTWKPREVIGRVRKFNDYPCVNMSHPAFSRRAVDVLRDFLEPNGELLPLISPLGEYFAYNVTTVADVLDWQHSDIGHWGKGREGVIASTIERFEFFANKMNGLSIFQIVEQPGIAFVTEIFANRVREHNLQGFNFSRVWPLPPGVSWWELHKRAGSHEQEKDLPRGQWVKGNTVVIRFMFAHPESEGTQEERKKINQIMDELDALLVNPDSNAPAFGSLEGDDIGVPGECRLFLSCPDADVLVEKLRPWLKKLRWPRFEVIKRYGEYVDPDAREVRVEL